MDLMVFLRDATAELGVDSPHFLAARWFGITLWQFVLAVLLIFLTLFARRLATLFLNRFVLTWLGRTGSVYPSKIVRSLTRPLSAAIGLFGLYMAGKVLLIPAPDAPRNVTLESFIDQTFQVAIAVIVIWAFSRLIDVFGEFLTNQAKANDLPVDVPIIPLLQRSLKVFIGVIGALLVIQHMGYPIASLLGGLGIGGLAVALAAQDTIANVFGSIIVFTDKPFKVGDWVRIGEVEGFVESIGFRSTRIRTWPKALVTLPNKTIANSHIENWSAMTARRVTFTLNVSYEATPEQIDELVRRIDEVITRHPGVNQDFHIVSFQGFGENGLEIFLYYFTISTAWKEHLRVRQEINLEIMRIMNEMNLSVALPSRRIYLSAPGSIDRTPGIAFRLSQEESQDNASTE